MKKDDQTWLKICYLLFAGIVAYVALKMFGTIGVQTGWSERYDEWYSIAANLCSLAVGTSSALWLRSSAERNDYYLASIGEIRKVAWPSAPDTKKMTIIVAVVVAIFSVILSIFDVAWSKVLQLILP